MSPRTASAACLTVVLLIVLGLRPAAQQPETPQPGVPLFRSSRNLISIDVIVRDKDGAIVRDLTAADFEVREDGKPQDVLTYSFQEIVTAPRALEAPADLLSGVGARLTEARPPAAEAPAAPLAARDLAGRRLLILLFDVSSMQPDDVQRAVDAGRDYVKNRMSDADLVAVATIGTALNVLTDFTSERETVDRALATLAFTDGTATSAPSASTTETDEAAAAADATAADSTEFDLFNNDLRLRAMKALAEALTPIEQKKAILYFSAGMQRSGEDNQVELRAAMNAAVRANLAIYPVDTRGLQAVVPGGNAATASAQGTALFSGRGVRNQFDRMSASQDSLVSMAADTGGQAFTDANDFAVAFERVQRDMSAYYLLGYSSTNSVRDGRFRRIEVRARRPGLRVEARAGYYAERDFSHTNRTDRRAALREQLNAAVSSTDLPVFATGGYFRVAGGRFYVPLSVAVPGSAVPVAATSGKVTLDVLGVVRDERGQPVGNIQDTLELPAGTAATLAGKQVLYQSGVTLPPGRFSLKVVVRENATGLIGSYEAPLVVPALDGAGSAPLKISSVVLSTQIEPATRSRGANPLVRDGIQIVPNLTHVVRRNQKIYFYYEIYDPAVDASDALSSLVTSLAFYRGEVKVFETPEVQRTTVDDQQRKAAVFRFEIPADRFTPGIYTCQVNAIDAVAGTFAFPRIALLVR